MRFIDYQTLLSRWKSLILLIFTWLILFLPIFSRSSPQTVAYREVFIRELIPGQCIQSPTNIYRFCFELDGSGCIYEVVSNHCVWNKIPAHQKATMLKIAEDGNLVALAVEEEYWRTNFPSYHCNNRSLSLQDDGKLILSQCDNHAPDVINSELHLTRRKLGLQVPTLNPTAAPILSPTSPTVAPTFSPTAIIASSLKSGLVAYYSFDNDVNDKSGNEYDGTPHSLTATRDRYGRASSAYTFRNSYVEIQGTPFNFDSTLSIALWVKPAATQVSFASIIDKSSFDWSSHTWNGGYIINQNGNYNNAYYFAFLPTIGIRQDSSIFTLTANAWNHLVVVKTSSQVIIYRNGVMVTLDYFSSNIYSTTSYPLLIGAANSGLVSPAVPTTYFNGSIDDVFIFNRVITLDEIYQLYSFQGPTGQPSGSPTSQPSNSPTNQPTRQPSNHPSSQPSRRPTSQPTGQPTREPTGQPTRAPSRQPTGQPSRIPTGQPVSHPTTKPTSQPTRSPTAQPTGQPTRAPTGQPISCPSMQPTSQPTRFPTTQPTAQPTHVPTGQPISCPSMQPTSQPTRSPTSQPTRQPTRCPSSQPSGRPTTQPSKRPTGKPSQQPVSNPSAQPTIQPGSSPTSKPSGRPSCSPSRKPSRIPSSIPSTQPSSLPTSVPTMYLSSRLRKGLLAYYSFSNNTKDMSGRNANGRINGAVSFGYDRFNAREKYVQFDKILKGYVEISGQKLPWDHQYSMCFWIKPAPIQSTNATVFSKFQFNSFSNSWNGEGFSFMQLANAANSFQFTCYSAVLGLQHFSQIQLHALSWTHIVFSVNTSVIVLYVNGLPYTEQPFDIVNIDITTAISDNANIPLVIGALNGGSTSPASSVSHYFSGDLDDLFIYNRALSQDEVQLLYSFESPTSQPTGRPSLRPSSLPTSHYTRSPTFSPTPFPTPTPSLLPTSQPSSRPSDVPHSRPTSLPSSLPSTQPSGQPSAQPTRQPVSSPTSRPVSNPTSQPSAQPSRVPFGRPSSSPSSQPSTRPSGEPSAQPSQQPVSQPTSVPSSQPSNTPSSHPSNVPSSIPFSRPSTLPSSQPSRQPSTVPSSLPSSQPIAVPSTRPSKRPTSYPSSQPTRHPTTLPTILPSSQPSRIPTGVPTKIPFSRPSSLPTTRPFVLPSAVPSPEPISSPSTQPTTQPSCQPSAFPTTFPTVQPSTQVSAQPSVRPTIQPTSDPTNIPTNEYYSVMPSITSPAPSVAPNSRPSIEPSGRGASNPTPLPSFRPSTQPSSAPTTSSRVPSLVTAQPTSQPSTIPTTPPTYILSEKPVTAPSIRPTLFPSILPTLQPSGHPSCHSSVHPSGNPSTAPSRQPVAFPSGQPSSHPSRQPTAQPSTEPHAKPTGQPSSQPSSRPSCLPTQTPTSALQLLSTAPTFSMSTLSASPSSQRFNGWMFIFGTKWGSQSILNEVSLSTIYLGSSFIILGDRTRSSDVALDHLSAAEKAMQIGNGGLLQDTVSRSTTNVGEINGDGKDDWVIGDPSSSRGYVLFGQSSSLTNLRVSVMLVESADPSSSTRSGLGWACSGLGDMNEDRYGDFIITAPTGNVAYVVYGRATRNFPSELVLSTMSRGQGYKIVGSGRDRSFGMSVSSGGDFNGDGRRDILISGLRSSSSSQATIYVILGNGSSVSVSLGMSSKPLVVSVDALGNSSYFKITTPKSSFTGLSVSWLGDMNGDGYDDVGIGSAPYQSGGGQQQTYVVYGRDWSGADAGNGTSHGNVLSLSGMRSGVDGFVVKGGGFMVAGVGDVDGDGLSDMMVTNYGGWLGKSNAYLSVYPKNITSFPTFQPTLSPTASQPSSQPTQSSTVRKTTFPPNLLQTSLPTKQPVISQAPSRSSIAPTVIPSPFPTTFFRSLKPTVIPTLRLTFCSPTLVPSASKSKRPSCQPTSWPSTLVPSTQQTVSQSIVIIDVNSPGEFSPPNVVGDGKKNLIIGVNGSVHIMNSEGRTIYTILPQETSTTSSSAQVSSSTIGGSDYFSEINIEVFRDGYDQLDLRHFPEYGGLADLPDESPPLKLLLSSRQSVVLENHPSFDLSPESVIFAGGSSSKSSQSKSSIEMGALGAGIALTVVVVAVIIVVVYKLYYRRLQVQSSVKKEILPTSVPVKPSTAPVAKLSLPFDLPVVRVESESLRPSVHSQIKEEDDDETEEMEGHDLHPIDIRDDDDDSSSAFDSDGSDDDLSWSLPLSSENNSDDSSSDAADQRNNQPTQSIRWHVPKTEVDESNFYSSDPIDAISSNSISDAEKQSYYYEYE